MLCPCCDQKMHDGYITSGDQIAYSEADSISAAMGCGESYIMFGTWKQVVIDGASAKAHYCQHCGKIIIDLNENVGVRFLPKAKEAKDPNRNAATRTWAAIKKGGRTVADRLFYFD